jgi:folate-binding protein YgfZ
MIVDATDWGHLRVTGGDRVRFLHGLTTINVEAMTPGEQRWGAVLNPKGRVLAVIQLERRTEELVIHCEGSIAGKTLDIFQRYAVMDDVELARLPDGPAYRVWTTPATAYDAPCVLGALPEPAAPATEVEAFRIAAGFVRYGADVDEDSFPFETPLAKFLDYEKGCYVGQEPVFRVRSQGNAARALRGLVLADSADVAPGTVVEHASRPNAGSVTSVGRSAAFGHVALAYLHRTVNAIGGTVVVGGHPATVTDLPMTEGMTRP